MSAFLALVRTDLRLYLTDPRALLISLVAPVLAMLGCSALFAALAVRSFRWQGANP